MTRRTICLAVLAMAFSIGAFAADPSGKWTATFETPIGEQHYTYTFKVSGGEVTGTAKNDMGESAIQNGKLNGDTVTFVEMLKFEDNEIRIQYTGKISADEIKFTRQVGDFGTEEFTAKRAK